MSYQIMDQDCKIGLHGVKLFKKKKKGYFQNMIIDFKLMLHICGICHVNMCYRLYIEGGSVNVIIAVCILNRILEVELLVPRGGGEGFRTIDLNLHKAWSPTDCTILWG